MRLTSFDIKNFRSIGKTSCHVTDNLTVLAGKNESGKTNVLDALTTLNDEIVFKETDRPLNLKSKDDVLIIFYFKLNNDEKEECVKDFQIDTKDLSDDVVIELAFNKNEYTIYGPFITEIETRFEKFFESEKPHCNDKIKEINKQLNVSNLQEKGFIETGFIERMDLATLDEKIIELKSIDEKLPRNPQNNQSLYPELTKLINELSNLLFPIRDQMDSVRDKIWMSRPKVVKFSSFDDILSSQVPYSEFTEANLKANHRIVYDLAKLADIDLDKFQTDDRQVRENLTEAAARITTSKFMEYWKQNPVEFKFRIDEPHVSIFVRDEGKEISYKPEQRSKGFQWYLSFYLRLEAQAREKNSLILIDEPGLYLHAKAQKDVLAVLENESKKNQVIFTTHSPYLIDPNELNRIRLVVKDEKTEQTILTNSFHKGADADTLTPIVTAIGLDLTRGLLFSKELNLVLEGISDYYYLRAMIEVLKKSGRFEFPENISLIPCVGNTNTGLIISLLYGLDLKYKVIIDKKGSIRVINRLKNSGLKDNEIIVIGETENDSIEELFEASDREKYQIDSKSINKAAISRSFYEKVKSGEYTEFSEATLAGFVSLLGIITKGLAPQENLEDAIQKIETDLKNILDGIVVAYSFELDEKVKNEWIKEAVDKIKTYTKLSPEKIDEIKNQFSEEIKIKIQKEKK